jgi:ankyrin repeat protein
MRVGWICTGLLLLPAMVSCRKPVDAEKSELKDAGYQLTTTDWLLAAGRDDVPALRKFLKAGFDAKSTDDSGTTALHAAARAGALQAAKFLLDLGLPVDAVDTAGSTPLLAAVAANQTESTRWLLRQGADPRHKEAQGFNALTLAVREGATGPLAEVAPYQRETLDSALLLAALIGRAETIDALTNYGASVYARMDDGRTALMLAAENGHAAAVELLLDLGASRFSTDANGKTAVDFATTAGHSEIAAMINRAPSAAELTLESPAELALSMDAAMDASQAGATTAETAAASTPPIPSPSTTPPRPPARPIQGETLSPAVAASGPQTAASREPRAFSMPPLVMRHYRERELPLEVRSVSHGSATLAIRGSGSRELHVRPGERIPETSLAVLRVTRRVQDSKLNLGQPTEVSVVEVRDESTGTTREWISGLPADAHDPVALVEDTATGQRYTATPGQRFRSEDGSEYIITDVRPNQLVIEDAATGNTQTIPLRGPRG